MEVRGGRGRSADSAGLVSAVLGLLPASLTGLFINVDQVRANEGGRSETTHLKGTWKPSDLELGATVGAGSYGRVRLVKAKDRPEAETMAVKILDKAKLIKKRRIRYAQDEMKVLGMVDHPFIVKLHACWQDLKSVYMMMDFVNGGELHSAIKGGVADKQAQLWIAEMVLAIEHLTSIGVVHRDVKPENTLLDNEGHLKLADFGIAKVVENPLRTLVGTPHYMAPEVIQRREYGCSVDWWALGILTYEVLAGFVPFEADTANRINEKILLGKYRTPSHFTLGARDLIRGLLQRRSRRLGCMDDGAEGVKTHAWFSTIDFNEVLHRRVPSSYVPTVSSAEDASQLHRVPEGVDDDLLALSAEEQALFNWDFCQRRSGGIEVSESVPFSVPADCACCMPKLGNHKVVPTSSVFGRSV
jgi:protein kinase A